MSHIRQQFTLFFTALQFYTRLPAPKWVVYKPENLSLATGYLPFVGWMVGMAAGATWLFAGYLTNPSIAILCSMIISILLTGAFHEDGFADVCDGFGGGWTREKILAIMKDSRVGAYASVGLILILALKFTLLQSIGLQIAATDTFQTGIISLLVTGHALSRLMPVFVIYMLPYARDTDSKAKPVAEKPPFSVLVTAIVFAVIPLLALAMRWSQPLLFAVIPVLGIITILLARYFKKWIGGYTGDCLGAIQQVCEIAFYFFVTVLWKFA
ncbi:adenosylcobinamide-GDP ribazoletransferase [Dyadobacter beijingensis]|uniref:Adenosylcobinamide-GDP ribazoletransferase n=1 Tax=Dyadobacter beijingensis TaxID=365489 RepID=A0ABQ2HLS7_9BACT|nr:adenosylcobinamide-GDP ribazoletransferase [Dyadobacter beijingensis]GGM83746.1 adenosylcobinamide-GDP ribazoletransferase [Dyadobacter beijingensis]